MGGVSLAVGTGACLQQLVREFPTASDERCEGLGTRQWCSWKHFNVAERI